VFVKDYSVFVDFIAKSKEDFTLVRRRGTNKKLEQESKLNEKEENQKIQ
jgi:hypothetical protein